MAVAPKSSRYVSVPEKSVAKRLSPRISCSARMGRMVHSGWCTRITGQGTDLGARCLSVRTPRGVIDSPHARTPWRFMVLPACGEFTHRNAPADVRDWRGDRAGFRDSNAGRESSYSYKESVEVVMRRFRNRSEAGLFLAARLSEYAERTDVVVLALPKGGVPVAAEVASALGAPLDVLVVRKIGVPWNPEFALGAIASGDMMVLDERTLDELGLTRADVEPVIQAERRELTRRESLYRSARPFPVLEGHIVILVDDGLATGATMQAAVAALRTRRPAQVVVAVPVASRSACAALAPIVDRVVCVETPEPFLGVGVWYDDFSQTTDQEVLTLLARYAEPMLA